MVYKRKLKVVDFNFYVKGVPLLFCSIMLLGSCSTKDNKVQDWVHFGYDASNNKFSPIENINLQNVTSLKAVWQYEDSLDGGSSVLFNPLVTKGKMFALMPRNRLVALDPTTGKPFWQFIPDSTQVSTWSRGITFNEGTKGRPDVLLFVDGSTLYCINAETGKLHTDFGKDGRVDFYEGLSIAPEMRSKIHVTANAPGVIYEDLFIIGCKVPDELPSTSGDIRAFNVHSGELEWIFHTIPKKGEFGAGTWAENARGKNGGANNWAGMALDEERGIVFVPTGSPSFDFYGADREGQNLFANSLLALDARNGKRIWHFQTTHHDLWDRDNGSPPNLVTVEHDGKMVDGVALPTKMGYIFLFDRETGEPLFPIEEVPVNTYTEMPGEKPWPTQPVPTKPEPFVRQGYQEKFYEDLPGKSSEYIKKELLKNNYNTGMYDPPSISGSVLLPAAQGGANWGGASFNPNSGVMFINAIDMPWVLKIKKVASLQENNSLEGKELFKNNCSSCHGLDKTGTNFGPDISTRVRDLSIKNLEEILKKGADPMPSFKHLPQIQIETLVNYLKGLEKFSNEIDATKLHSTHAEPYGFSGYDFFLDSLGLPAIKPPYGTLTAIDLNQGEILWQVPLGEDKELLRMGIENSGLFNRGGGIATAGGLVFIAATSDAMLRGFNQKSGKIEWQTKLPGNGFSIPSTYEIDGKQYLTIGVSPNPKDDYNGGYITFALDEQKTHK